MAQYSDPILEKLKAVLSAGVPTAFKKRFYIGDPILVDKSSLPAVFITRDKTSVSNLTNAEDQSRMPIVLNVVYDLTRDLGQGLARMSSDNALYEIVEGRNADYTLKTTSIAYILRANQVLDTRLWIDYDGSLEIEYGIGIEKRGPGIYTVEAKIALNIVHNQLRPGI